MDGRTQRGDSEGSGTIVATEPSGCDLHAAGAEVRRNPRSW